MTIAQSYLPEFEREMGMTRTMLERVTDGILDYTPHPKSMTTGQLASHIAQMPEWGAITARVDDLDINPPDGPALESSVAGSVAELMEAFDKNVADMTAAVGGLSDEQMLAQWTLLSGGHELFTMPRVAVFQSMVLSHIIHHRAQLGVYLRMNDVPVPGMYGPSADDEQAG
ncbi:MAG: DinB family protein [Bryobacterales bacterium]|nr:DinB family protein [Bryobacterales bacterium]